MVNLLTAKEAEKLYKDSVKLKEMEAVFTWFNKEVRYACKQAKNYISISEYSWRDNLGDGIGVFEKELLASGFSIDKEYKNEPDMFNHGKPESIKMVTISWNK